MSSCIPEGFQDLLEKPINAAFVTLMPDGSPHVSVVWYLWEEPYISISTSPSSRKGRNIARDRRVALVLNDTDDKYRYLGVQGVVEAIEHDPEGTFADRLWSFYEGRTMYNGQVPAEEQEHLYVYRIRPVNYVSFSE